MTPYNSRRIAIPRLRNNGLSKPCGLNTSGFTLLLSLLLLESTHVLHVCWCRENMLLLFPWGVSEWSAIYHCYVWFSVLCNQTQGKENIKAKIMDQVKQAMLHCSSNGSSTHWNGRKCRTGTRLYTFINIACCSFTSWQESLVEIHALVIRMNFWIWGECPNAIHLANILRFSRRSPKNICAQSDKQQKNHWMHHYFFSPCQTLRTPPVAFGFALM